MVNGMKKSGWEEGGEVKRGFKGWMGYRRIAERGKVAEEPECKNIVDVIQDEQCN